MDVVVAVVSDGLTILGALVSVYLAVGIGLAFLGAQVDAALGRPSGRDIFLRIALLAFCVALVAFARSVSATVGGLLGGDLASAAATRMAILRIGQYFLDVVIGTAAVVLAVGVAMGLVGAQLATVAGEALHLSEVLSRLFMLVALAAGAFLAIAMANAIIAAMR
jgi:hypothetical protein